MRGAHLVRLPEAGGTRDRAASPEEAAELLEALPVEHRALWATAFYAGLRRGELRALRVDDIDFPEATTIHVRRSWDEKEGEIRPKTEAGERKVPVPGILRSYLLEEKVRTGRDGQDLLFGRTASEPFTPTWIRKLALKAWAQENERRTEEAAGRGVKKPRLLEPIGLHEARHTYVSLMHVAGVPLERIGDYVGHSGTYMTERYRHLIEGLGSEDAEAFDRLVNGRTSARTGAQATPSGRKRLG